MRHRLGGDRELSDPKVRLRQVEGTIPLGSETQALHVDTSPERLYTSGGGGAGLDSATVCDICRGSAGRSECFRGVWVWAQGVGVLGSQETAINMSKVPQPSARLD